MAGSAHVIDDRAKERELWNPMNKAFFEGRDDPELVLLHVDPERAEYSDAPNGAMRQLSRTAGTHLLRPGRPTCAVHASGVQGLGQSLEFQEGVTQRRGLTEMDTFTAPR